MKKEAGIPDGSPFTVIMGCTEVPLAFTEDERRKIEVDHGIILLNPVELMLSPYMSQDQSAAKSGQEAQRVEAKLVSK